MSFEQQPTNEQINLAIQLRQLFEALTRAGFSDDQAMSILLTAIQNQKAIIDD